MSISICFKCGGEKAGPYDACPACREAPVFDHDRVVSLVLSSRRSTRPQLETYAGDIRRYGRPIIDAEVLQEADEEWQRSKKQIREAKRALELIPSSGGRPESGTKIRDDAPAQTRIEQNAFALLGATTRDPRRRIVELAEEKSLTLDSSLCLKARADLLAPRTRLGIEMSWMPGVAPQRASTLLALLRVDLDKIINTVLPPLARANLLAAAFELLDPEMDEVAWLDWMMSLAETLDEIELESVLRDINEDRAVAGIPEVKQLDMVEEEMLGRRQHYKTVIKAALDMLPSENLVELLTNLVKTTTNDGKSHAPLFVDEILDIYQAEADVHLQEGAERITRFIDETKSAASKGAGAVKPYMGRLEGMLRAWNNLAKPIQVSLKARGQDHMPSRNLAYQVRSLGIELFNEHDLVDLVRDFTGRLRDIFADLPEVKQKLQEDSHAIQDVVKGREERKKESEEFAREISYEAEVGIIFKDMLKISPAGLQWKEEKYPLEKVTRVRWGGVNQSGSVTYTIAFGDDGSESRIQLSRTSTYQNFTERLWKAVCSRLVYEMLVGLKAGRQFSFGDGTVDDEGVHLTKHKFLGSERIYVKWGDTHIWSHDGSFYIGAKADKKAYASMSYMETENAHICEAVIRTAFKQGAIPLSNLLRKN